MFLLLTRILLWLLIGTIFYYLLLRILPKKYLTWFGGLVLFIFVVLAFINPAQSRLVSDAWTVLSFPLKPLGLAIVLLMTALRKGAKAVTGNQVLAALIILTLSSVPIVASSLAQQAEREAIVFERTPVTSQRVAAIVVLAQGTTQSDQPSADPNSRLAYAAQLYQQQSPFGNAPLMIVNTDIDPNEITRQLGRLGVPETQVVIDPRGVDLRTSAEEVNRIMSTRGLRNRRVLLVSPAINSRRATLTFANFGITAIPRSTEFVDSSARSLRVENFVPNVQSMVVTTRVVNEFLTSIYYFLRGWQAPAVT